ncbi:unnamed protein product [Discula destructiva]
MAGFKSPVCLAVLASAGLLQGSIAASVQQPLLISGNSHTNQAQLSSASAKPLVDSEALQAAISADKLLTRAKELFHVAELSQDEYNRPTRVIGSEGHVGTLKYIQDTISELGDYYKAITQPFAAYSGSVSEFRLVLGDAVARSASPMGLTPPTKDKEPVHGDLVLVNGDGCDSADYPSAVKGNIALIRRGTCAFGAKSAHAGQAGAAAAVIYNNEKGTLHGTMGTPEADHVATFGIDLYDAETVLDKLKNGKRVDAIAYIDGEVKTIMTSNVVIQTAEGDPDNCVMVGAHSDSVGEGPGINDDGSGTLSLLEVATALTKFSVNNCVRFGWWSGEEEGLLGSNHYASTLTDEENLKIRLFADYDMMASPNFAYQIYNATNDESPVGSQELRDLYVDWYEAHDLNYTFIDFDGRSDYDGFIRAGIPAGGIATGAEGKKTKEEVALFGGKAGDWYDPCYHQLCDDVGNNNLTAWEINTKLIAHSVATYATSFKGFPKRDPADLAAMQVSDKYAQSVKYRGSRLFW